MLTWGAVVFLRRGPAISSRVTSSYSPVVVSTNQFHSTPLPFQKSHSSEKEGADPSTSSKRKKVVGILGGGISGLSAAYYLVKKFGSQVQPVIFEKDGRVGGWMRTVTTSKGTRFEMGPRTIRLARISGLNTLDLMEELKLDKEVLFVQRNHPTANNRYIYVKEKLARLPSDSKSLFKKQEPFNKALIWGAVKDLFAFRKRAEDDSIHGFVSRRFGKEIADYLVDPLIRGISAGDSKKISVKFLLKSIYELEQQYGSVIIGQLLSRLGKNKCQLTDEEKTIGFSKIAIASLHQNWAVWTLEQGLGELASTMERFLLDNKVQIRMNTTVSSLRMERDVAAAEIKFHTHNDERRSDSITVNHIISTIPSVHLAEVMKYSRPPNPELKKLLETIESESLQVTGLMYNDPNIIDTNSFGFLVPSSEKSVEGLLGVVFDTNSFPQGDNTVITVMSRGPNGSMQDLDKIKWYVEKTLGITKEPDEHHSEILSNCIPQYNVGHYEKINAIKRFIKAAKFPLTLAGASWDGVSVNDCIYGGRKAVDEIGKVDWFDCS